MSLKPGTIQDLIDHGYVGPSNYTHYQCIVNDSVCALPGCTKKEINVMSPVLNRQEISEFIWVKLTPEFKGLKLISINQVQPIVLEDIVLGSVVFDRTWIRIPTVLLNTTCGKHEYLMKFLDSRVDVPVNLYFGYIIQDNNPDKPYIYMNKDQEDDNI